MGFSVKITIPSDTRYLAPMRGLIAAIGKIEGRKRFSRRAQIACTLALIEAIDNAIFHAHGHSRAMPISVEVTIERALVKMTVIDRGPGLDHPSIHAPNLNATKGRGLYMMDRLMDSVESIMSHRGHELILKMNI